MKHILFAVLLLVSGHAYSASWTGSFKITAINIENSMNIRVSGLGSNMCSGGPTWAYVGEVDPVSKTKLAALLSAFAAGKNVNLKTNSVDYFSNGSSFCQIVAISVVD